MDEKELGGMSPEQMANEEVTPEQKPEEKPKEEIKEPEKKEPEAPKTPEEKPKEEKPEVKPEEKKEPEKPEPSLKEKRRVYEALKERKAERNAERERADKAEKERDELAVALETLKSAKTPEAKQEAEDDLKTLAEELGLENPEVLKKMKSAFLKDLKPSNVSPEDVEFVKNFRTEQAEKAKQQEADKAEMAFAKEWKDVTPILAEQFSQTDGDFSEVEKEVKRLAHTEEFADKELDYIIWKKRADLSKLVTPKKKSFEAGSNNAGHQQDESPIDYSGSVTPEQLQKSSEPGRRSALEIRSRK
jgi:hypothetical protein